MKPVTCSGSMGIFSYTVDPHAEFSLKQHKENMYINNEYIKETKKKEKCVGLCHTLAATIMFLSLSVPLIERSRTR
jgi:hypothetical protein